jgi:hypothetical protein
VTSGDFTVFIYVDAEHISWRRIARLKPQPSFNLTILCSLPYPLILSMKKLFMPCFWLARSANIKEMHKPRQEADPLFQPPVKVLDQWHLGIEVPTGAVA